VPRPGHSPRLDPEAFRLIRALVNEAAGLALPDDARASVERKLAERLLSLRLEGFHEYYRYLRYHAQRRSELETALEALTTNETYFFRELQQLQAFEREVLPALSRAGRERRTLNVWSAGCATGEEVYTLAILIVHSGFFQGWDVRVLGNDISRRCLQTARRGVYREASFRAMPAGFERYFAETAGGLGVVPEIRALCHFAHLNLMDEPRMAILGKVDAIFCRNVLIYFDQVSRRRVIQSFYDRLHPEGFLMLGHSESLLHTSTAFELCHLRGDLAYRKPARTAPGAVGEGQR
jgi:chemotaxis protein methyltransferase CheR